MLGESDDGRTPTCMGFGQLATRSCNDMNHECVQRHEAFEVGVFKLAPVEWMTSERRNEPFGMLGATDRCHGRFRQLQWQ